MNDKLLKKSKSLKSAIERYNMYKKFVDQYSHSSSLDNYIEFINENRGTMSESLNERYDKMILQYNYGNKEPLLSNLYDRLLAADDYRNKLAAEVKSLLG